MEARASLIALYEEVVHALGARRLSREACLRGALPDPLPGGRLFVLGIGKVSAELYLGACDAFGELPAVLAIPQGTPTPPQQALCVVGGHPLPTAGSLAAGEALLHAATQLGPKDVALVLLSGGGSALAESTPLLLPDLLAVNDALLRSGAPIEEMNLVRAHLSRLKGGGLARALFGAGVRRGAALVAVDVPKGGMRAVSSGPASADPGTYQGALNATYARKLALPEAALSLLRAGARGEYPETLKPGEPADFLDHQMLCDMTSPAREAAQRAQRPCLQLPLVSGPLEEFARRLTDAAQAQPGILLVASGEPELRIPATAPAGGRAQHLALWMARALRGTRAAFLAAGTDGRDGNTSAAGAAVDGESWDEAERRGLHPDQALASFGATPLLEALGRAIPARHSEAHCGELYLLLSALP